jgi:aarF domain-containing kinase
MRWFCSKLSGAFLLAAKLNAKVDCKKIWEEVTEGYVFEEEEAKVLDAQE